MSVAAQRRIPVQEYLKLDHKAERASDYFDGLMVEVESATRNHALISSNLLIGIGQRFRESKKNCEVYGQDLRVYLPSTNRYVHPDLTVTCGSETLAEYDTLLNPVLIVEVLSPATEDHDKGRKFDGYRSIPSLKEYLTAAQDRVHIDQWTFTDGIWSLIRSYKQLADSLELSAGGFCIPLGEVYRNVEIKSGLPAV
jgi:Uma2 family endonuclease